MAFPFLRAALAAVSRHRATTLAAAAPRGAAPAPARYPLLPFASAERVGGFLLLLPRRAGAASSPAAPAQVRAAAFSTDAGAALEEVHGPPGKNGGKAEPVAAGEGQEAAAAAAASPCRFDENLAAHLKGYIRGHMIKEIHNQSLIMIELFEKNRNYRDTKNRSESYRQLVFSALVAVLVGELMRRKENRAKAGGTGGDKVVEVVGEETDGDKIVEEVGEETGRDKILKEVGEETKSGGKPRTAVEDDAKAGGKASTGAEDTKDSKADDADDSKAGRAKDSKQGGSAEDKAGSCSGAEAAAKESKGAAGTP